MRRGLKYLLLLMAAASSQLLAQTAPVPEYALKSALLFKLPQFVYRPDADRTGPLTLCLIGSNSFGNALDKLAQTTLDGRRVSFRHLARPEEAAGCEFVFISRSEARDIGAVFRRIGPFPVVTVSDIEGFAQAGGMVEFALPNEGSAISILINRRAAQRQGIEFNAQLLRLSKVIEP
jgi:hypothetical protein